MSDTQTQFAQTQLAAQETAAQFGAILLRAQKVANAIAMGDHGRRRAGMGDAFWQYRPFDPQSDSARVIDWRRSAKAEGTFVRERELKTAQKLALWVDQSASMRFGSRDLNKADTAMILGLGVALSVHKAGEQSYSGDGIVPPARGTAQAFRLYAQFTSQAPMSEYDIPEMRGLVPRSTALLISDFLGDLQGVEETLSRASALGVGGAIVQILDPIEEEFPFRGRTLFESMSGAHLHETQHAVGLRSRYLQRLEDHKAALRDLAFAHGWSFFSCPAGVLSQEAILPIWSALSHAAGKGGM